LWAIINWLYSHYIHREYIHQQTYKLQMHVIHDCQLFHATLFIIMEEWNTLRLYFLLHFFQEIDSVVHFVLVCPSCLENFQKFWPLFSNFHNKLLILKYFLSVIFSNILKPLYSKNLIYFGCLNLIFSSMRCQLSRFYSVYTSFLLRMYMYILYCVL